MAFLIIKEVLTLMVITLAADTVYCMLALSVVKIFYASLM